MRYMFLIFLNEEKKYMMQSNKVQAILSPSAAETFRSEKTRLEGANLQKVSDSFVLNRILEEYAVFINRKERKTSG